MTVFAFNVVKLNTALLPGQAAGSFDPRERDDIRGDDGSLHQTSATVSRTAPRADFTTVAVRTLVLLLTAGGQVPYVALDGTNGIEMFGLRINTAGGVGRDTGNVHARRKFAAGLLCLNQLSWQPGGLLEASCSAFATSAAGGTDPVVADTVAAPTVPVNTERLVLTGLTIGALSFTRVSSFAVGIGHQVENNDDTICYDKGLPFPLLCKQPGVGGPTDMVATIETPDLTSPVANGVLTATFNTLQHKGVGVGATGITVALNGAFARARPIANNRRRIEIRGLWDGTTLPLTIAAF